MSPGERAFLATWLPIWRLKVEDSFAMGRYGAAIGLEIIVKREEARLAAAGPAVAESPPPVDALRARLAIVSPREHPHYPGVMINSGPIMSAVRADLEARLGIAGASPAPAISQRVPWFHHSVAPAGGAPERDPEPFVAGPQIGLF